MMGCFWNGKFMSRPARGGGRGAKYLGLGLVSGTEILVKRLVMGATAKMVGACNVYSLLVLGPDPGFCQPWFEHSYNLTWHIL